MNGSDTEDSSPAASSMLDGPTSPSNSIIQSLQQQPVITTINSHTAASTSTADQLQSILSGSPNTMETPSLATSLGLNLDAPIFKMYRDPTNSRGGFSSYTSDISSDYVSLLSQQNGFMGPAISDDEFSDFLANLLSPTTTANPMTFNNNLDSQFDVSPLLASDDLKELTGIQVASTVQANVVAGLLQPCYANDGSGPLDEVKPIVQDSHLMDELCEIFK